MIVNILIVIAALIAIILILALVVPKKYHIESQIIIRKNKDEIFEYIRYLKNQDFYSKWVMSDPSKKTAFRGSDGSVGFVYAWDSQNKSAGKGEQEIISIQENKYLDIELRFEKPFEGIAQARMSTENIAEGQTKVTWSMEGEQKYPMNLMSLIMNKLLTKDLNTSLINLKNIIEKE